MSSEIRKGFKSQGHYHTGSLVRSVGVRIEQEGTTLTGIVEFNYYGEYVNTGVKSINIPFRKNSGRKSSKYIDALVDYFRKKGLSPKESKSAAFATAMKHKKEGMPTNSSKRFSSTGKRTGAVNDAVEKLHPQIERGIEEKLSNLIVAQVDIPFAELQKVA